MRYLVIGAAGHAQEVAWSLVEERGRDCELRFFDDAVGPGPVACGLGDVVGRLDDVANHVRGDEVALVLGIGRPRIKRAVVARLATLDVPWATVVHPRATIGPNVELGAGSYVAVGAVVTLNVRMGRFATINTHCQVAHDGIVGEFATLHPSAHVAGCVAIGEGCELGTGASVIPGVAIGDWAVLGAGCVATTSLRGGATYVGVPARAARSPAAERRAG